MNAMPEQLHPAAIPFSEEWPDADLRLLQAEIPEPPALPLDQVFSVRWADWMRKAAECKGAPADYVVASVLSVCGSLIGNTRWASPWQGWAEPPVPWFMVIGNPSAGKSPGLDAVLMPLKKFERQMRESAQTDINDWRAKAEVARLAESTWKEAVKAAIKAGEEPPSRPESANPGPEPVMPRLAVSDATVEKLAVIMSSQPRGTLLARDELAGWLQGMSRYSGGGSDRPFWLEAYGGRAYSVERMGRDPVYIDRLTLGVLGGIQPDRLRSLLIKSDDDGLLARLMPVWPHPAPVKRPEVFHDETFIENAIARLLTLQMPADEHGERRPRFVPFTNDARDLLDGFRQAVRSWEIDTEGLMLSFIGKLPGVAVRLALVLALMEWASGEAQEPQEITINHFGRPERREAWASQPEFPARAAHERGHGAAGAGHGPGAGEPGSRAAAANPTLTGPGAYAAFFRRRIDENTSAPATMPAIAHLKGSASAVSLRIGRTVTVPGRDSTPALPAAFAAAISCGETTHSALVYQTPAVFAAQITAMGDQLRAPEPLRRSPIAPSAQPRQVQTRTLVSAG